MEQRKSREVWFDRVQRWQASGLSAEAFSAREGCHPKTLDNWRWKFRLGQQGKAHADRSLVAAAKPRFVEVISPRVVETACEAASISEPVAPFELTLRSGARLVVPARFDRRSLEALVDIVEAR
jgi:hypothetical protein